MPRRNEYPLVTVLMAVYNGEKYLREAIQSVLTQTYVNFEFLIINDGSYDATEEIILSYSDERIRYVKNEQKHLEDDGHQHGRAGDINLLAR